MSTADGWLKTQLCKLRDKSDTLIGLACVLDVCSICNLVLLNYVYKMVRVCSIFIPHERYRSVTRLGATRVNRTILQGRC